MEANKVFGEVLRSIRLEKAVSQETLAEKSNFHRTYISLLERGKRQPTITAIFRLAEALDQSPSEMIKEVELQILQNFTKDRI